MHSENPTLDPERPASRTPRSAAASALHPVAYIVPRRSGARLMHPLEVERLG
jgi:hypothetical protein